MSWSSVKLGDACDVIAGGTPKRSEPSYWGGDIPWVKISDMLKGRISRTEESITRAGLQGSSAKLLPPGTLLVSIFATIGRTAVLECEAATNQAIVGVVPRHQGQFDDGFLRYSLRKKTQELQRQGRGVAQANINASVLKATELPVPPLAEQRQIAAILDAADALRARRSETIAQLDTLLQSTFLDMFGDPVTNPMGWDVMAFGSIGHSKLGKMLDKGKEVGDCQFPYLANANVQWGRFDLAELRTMDFSESDRKKFNLEDGDLLICEGGEVGRTAIWRGAQDRIYFQKALHRVRLDPAVAVPEYVVQFMWFMAKNGGFRNLTTSATIAHLTGVKLKRARFPRPPLELQLRYAAIVESVEKQKARQQVHLTELNTLFASLQSRAFRGDL